MGNVQIISRKELRMRKKMSREDMNLFQEFKVYLSRIDGDNAGIYEFSRDEDHKRGRALLRKAAKALDVPLRIIEEEDSLVFYRKVLRVKKD